MLPPIAFAVSSIMCIYVYAGFANTLKSLVKAHQSGTSVVRFLLWKPCYISYTGRKMVHLWNICDANYWENRPKERQWTDSSSSFEELRIGLKINGNPLHSFKARESMNTIINPKWVFKNNWSVFEGSSVLFFLILYFQYYHPILRTESSFDKCDCKMFPLRK